jgi:hypothetical protein
VGRRSGFLLLLAIVVLATLVVALSYSGRPPARRSSPAPITTVRFGRSRSTTRTRRATPLSTRIAMASPARNYHTVSLRLDGPKRSERGSGRARHAAPQERGAATSGAASPRISRRDVQPARARMQGSRRWKIPHGSPASSNTADTTTRRVGHRVRRRFQPIAQSPETQLPHWVGGDRLWPGQSSPGRTDEVPV